MQREVTQWSKAVGGEGVGQHGGRGRVPSSKVKETAQTGSEEILDKKYESGG